MINWLPLRASLRLVFCVAFLAHASCGSESVQQRALRLQEEQEAARETLALVQACIKLDAHWSLDPTYATEGGVDRCVESMEAELAQLRGGAPADKLQRAHKIRALQAAACEIRPESEQC